MANHEERLKHAINKFQLAQQQLFNIPVIEKAYNSIRNQLIEIQYEQELISAKKEDYEPFTKDEFMALIENAPHQLTYLISTIGWLFQDNNKLNEKCTKFTQDLGGVNNLNNIYPLKDPPELIVIKQATDIMLEAIDIYKKNPNIIKTFESIKKNIVFISSLHSMFKVGCAFHTKKAFGEIDMINQSVLSKNEAVELVLNNIANLQLINSNIEVIIDTNLEELLNKLGPTVTQTFMYILSKVSESPCIDGQIIMDVEQYFAKTKKVRCTRTIDQFKNDMKVMQHALINVEVKMKEEGVTQRLKVPLLAYHGISDKNGRIKDFIVKLGDWVGIVKENMKGARMELPPEAFQIDHGKTPQATIYGYALDFRWKSNRSNRKERHSKIDSKSLLLKWEHETLSVKTLLNYATEWDNALRQSKKRGWSQPYKKFIKNLNEAANSRGYTWNWQESPKNAKTFFDGVVVYAKYK